MWRDSVIKAEYVIENYKLAQQSLAIVASIDHNHKEEKWDDAADNWYKLNTNTTIKSPDGICSLGAIIKYSKGEVMGSISQYKAFFLMMWTLQKLMHFYRGLSYQLTWV